MNAVQGTLVIAGMVSLGLLLGLAACTSTAAGVTAFRVGDLQTGDVVSVTVEGRAVMLDICSAKGIGSAAIEQTAGPAPETLVLRFHLAGLEGLRFAYEDTVVNVQVSSLEAGGVSQEAQLPGEENKIIGPDSPYWMAVRIPDGQTIPVRDGYIEVSAPRAFFERGASRFTLRWIDFYR